MIESLFWAYALHITVILLLSNDNGGKNTRSQAVARIADRTAKNSSGHMT